jgi:hypothetical protein
MDVGTVNPTGQSLPVVPDTYSPNWLVENRELIQTVKGVNAAELFGQDSELTFAMDRDTKRLVVKVIDRQTHEVLWQAPPEYLLAVDRALQGDVVDTGATRAATRDRYGG